MKNRNILHANIMYIDVHNKTFHFEHSDKNKIKFSFLSRHRFQSFSLSPIEMTFFVLLWVNKFGFTWHLSVANCFFSSEILVFRSSSSCYLKSIIFLNFSDFPILSIFPFFHTLIFRFSLFFHIWLLLWIRQTPHSKLVLWVISTNSAFNYLKHVSVSFPPFCSVQ